MTPTERIIKAYLDPGRNIRYHQETKARLKKEWPVLANAIEALIQQQRIS